MSEAYRDLQKQSIDAEIELWELEIATSTYAYFYSGLDEGLAEIQFRDRVTPSTIRTYTALPLEGNGFAVATDGPANRPTLTVANILSSFSNELGGLTNKELLGKKIYRRRTLAEYLYPGDTTNPPIEYPEQMYFIDRISSQTALSITFELATPYDLNGIEIPRRVILGNGCPWQYQGASDTLGIASKCGGCNWDAHSRISGTVAYFNGKGEPVINSSGVDTSFTSVVESLVYRTTANSANIRKIEHDGTYSSAGTLYDYWQANITSAAPGTPSDDNDVFRRCKVFTSYSSGTTYDVYTDENYNEYVTYTTGGEPAPRLWQVKGVTQDGGSHDAVPSYSKYWKLGDECGKMLNDCNSRYNYIAVATVQDPSVDVPAAVERRTEPLPFGGFPGSRIFR